MVILALPLLWATMFVDHVGIFVGSCVLGAAFFGLTAVVVMWGVVRWYTATVHSIYGAVSAYLLLGLAGAMLYWSLDLVDGNSLHMPHKRTLQATVGGEERPHVHRLEDEHPQGNLELLSLPLADHGDHRRDGGDRPHADDDQTASPPGALALVPRLRDALGVDAQDARL